MRRLLAGGLALLLTAALPVPQPPDKPPDKPDAKSRAEQLKAIQTDMEKAQREFISAYTAAKTNEERQAALAKQPKREEFADRAWKLIEADPKDAVAGDALVWVLQIQPYGPRRQQAADLLAKHHITHPKIGDALRYGASESLMRAVMEKSPHAAARAKAAFALAEMLHEQGKGKEAEALFEKIIADKTMAAQPHYRGNLGKAAEGYLFEIRHLAIGKEAPEITGEDIEGQPLRLSDFRGKVVVLDFWGHW